MACIDKWAEEVEPNGAADEVGEVGEAAQEPSVVDMHAVAEEEEQVVWEELVFGASVVAMVAEPVVLLPVGEVVLWIVGVE